MLCCSGSGNDYVLMRTRVLLLHRCAALCSWFARSTSCLSLKMQTRVSRARPYERLGREGGKCVKGMHRPPLGARLPGTAFQRAHEDACCRRREARRGDSARTCPAAHVTSVPRGLSGWATLPRIRMPRPCCRRALRPEVSRTGVAMPVCPTWSLGDRHALLLLTRAGGTRGLSDARRVWGTSVAANAFGMRCLCTVSYAETRGQNHDQAPGQRPLSSARAYMYVLRRAHAFVYITTCAHPPGFSSTRGSLGPAFQARPLLLPRLAHSIQRDVALHEKYRACDVAGNRARRLTLESVVAHRLSCNRDGQSCEELFCPCVPQVHRCRSIPWRCLHRGASSRCIAPWLPVLRWRLRTHFSAPRGEPPICKPRAQSCQPSVCATCSATRSSGDVRKPLPPSAV